MFCQPICGEEGMKVIFNRAGNTPAGKFLYHTTNWNQSHSGTLSRWPRIQKVPYSQCVYLASTSSPDLGMVAFTAQTSKSVDYPQNCKARSTQHSNEPPQKDGLWHIWFYITIPIYM